MSKIIATATCFSLFCLLTLVTNTHAEVYETTLTLTAQEITNSGATSLDLGFNIGAGQVHITQTGDTGYVVQAVVSYSDESLEPTLTKTVSETIYQADFKSGDILGPFLPGTLHEWEIMIGSYTTPTRLTINLGAVLAEMDLGGMPVTTLLVNLGADNIDIDFSTPSYLSMSNVTVNCGGANLTMDNIGNTDFGRFIINGGGFGAILDFNGQYSEGVHQVLANLAGSAASITMPLDAGESINAQTIASVLKVTGDGVIRVVKTPFYKRYVTDDYEAQGVKLNYGVVAVGSTVFMDRN